MSDAVLVGIISVVGSVLVQLIVSHSRNRETDAKAAAREQKQEDWFENIETWMQRVDKKLDEHNGYAQKFADASRDIAVIKTKLEERNKK